MHYLITLLSTLTVLSASLSDLQAQKAETIQETARKLYGHRGDVSALTVSQNGSYMATGSVENKVILWSTGDKPTKEWAFQAHESTVEGVDISHDNAYLASCSNDANAYIWSIEDEKRSLTLGGHKSNINDISFNDNFDKNKGRFVATATKRGIVRVYDREKEGKLIRKIELEKGGAANAVIFDKGGKYVVIGTGSGAIHIYNFLTGKKARSFNKHSDAINSLALSPDGLQLVSGSSDQTAKIWSYAKGNVLHTLKGHTWRVLDVAFGPDGNYVVTGSNDQTARLWEVSSGKQIRIFKPEGRDYFRAVDMTPDGKHAITGSLVREQEGDPSVLMWSTGL